MTCFTRICKLMGSSFELGIIHSNKAVANQLLSEGISEIKRIESVLSTFNLLYSLENESYPQKVY